MRRALAPIVLLLLGAGLLAGCGGGDDDVTVSGDSVPADPTTTTEGPTSTAAPTTSTTDAGGGATVLWPPAGTAPTASATDAALAFATDYLGIADARTSDDDSDAGCAADVPVTKGTATATTTVHVAQGADGCVIIGADADTIVVDGPGTGATITSPVGLSGQADAFEGTVVVQVRAAASTEALGEGFVTGAQGTLGAFEGSLAFTGGAAGEPAAVVFYAPDASGDGTAVAATVVPVRFG